MSRKERDSSLVGEGWVLVGAIAGCGLVFTRIQDQEQRT